jgi:uncharacterized protein YdeI (YjbR/CyaY-like superfamily)
MDPKDEKKSRLIRPHYPMPGFVSEALQECGLMDAYQKRPPYQQNDYVGWITRAKREDTQSKRLARMLDELMRGDVYMNMHWNPPSKGRPKA